MMTDKIEWHPNGTPGPFRVNTTPNLLGNDIFEIRSNDGSLQAWAWKQENAQAFAEVPAMVQALRDLDKFWSEDGKTPDDPFWTPQIRRIWLEARAILSRIDGEAA